MIEERLEYLVSSSPPSAEGIIQKVFEIPS